MMCLTRETIQDLPTAAETSEQYDVACYLHKSKRSLGEEELVQITQDCGDGPPAEGTKKVDSSSGSTSQSLVKPGQHKAHEAEGAVKRSADDQHSYSTDMPDVNLPQADCVKQTTTTTVQEVAVGTEEPCQQEGSPAVQIDAKSSDEAVCTADAQSTATEQSPSNCVFFARVPPTVPYESIHALFSQFGKVLNLNLFRPWASAKTSKGCGIVEYEEPACAMAAMNALHTKYHWTGGETTMVVEWMDPARHRKDRQQEDGSAGQGKAFGNSRINSLNKTVRKRNKSNLGCVPPMNIAVALPGLGGRAIPLMGATAMHRLTPGLQGIATCANPGLQQASWMLGAHASTGRRASYPGSVGAAYQLDNMGAAGSLGHNMTVDGSFANPDALWQALSCGTPNVMPQMMSSIPTQLAAHYNGMTGTSPAGTSISAGTCPSWPLPVQAANGQLPQGSLSNQSAINASSMPAAPNVASMLLQRHQRPQGWAALMPTAGSYAESPTASGSYMGSEPASMPRTMGSMGSMGNLERCLGNVGGVNQMLGGFATGVGDINTEASAITTAGLQYLADLQGKLDLLRTGSPMAGTPNSLFNSADGSFMAPVAPAHMGTNDAASWLMAQGAGHMSGSPLDAGLAPGTPTYLSQTIPGGVGNLNPGVAAHSLLNNRHGSAQSFGGSANMIDPQLAAVARMAGSGMHMGNPVLGDGSNSNLMMQLMCDMPAGSNMSNLMAAGTGHTWGGM